MFILLASFFKHHSDSFACPTVSTARGLLPLHLLAGTTLTLLNWFG
jgi:hypothetical protein